MRVLPFCGSSAGHAHCSKSLGVAKCGFGDEITICGERVRRVQHAACTAVSNSRQGQKHDHTPEGQNADRRMQDEADHDIDWHPRKIEQRDHSRARQKRPDLVEILRRTERITFYLYSKLDSRYRAEHLQREHLVKGKRDTRHKPRSKRIKHP